MSDDFPPNSHTSKQQEQPTQEPKNVGRVVQGEAIRRKRGIRKQFKRTFINGDARTAFEYVVYGVLIPAAKDALAEAGAQGIERLIFGESRRKAGPRPSGPTGYVQYNRFSMGNRPVDREPALSQRARAAHDFDEIILETRMEAEEVIERLFDLVSRYSAATVADLYELVGLKSMHTDHKWGWANLRGAGVSRVRGGYLLDLPEPEPIN